NWKVVFANRAAHSLYGYSAFESFLDLFNEESRIEFLQKLLEAFDASQLNGCYQHSKVDNEPLFVDLYAAEIKKDEKRLYQVSVI
ncbi:hypothetical protein, partial [Salmonella sp. SAL4360]|uniref:hypothetical protein n=1 Tax=Salmonella sp. SAL4360 TaxID=3159881 RepID=UPI00397A072A